MAVTVEEWMAELQRLATATPSTEGFLSFLEIKDRTGWSSRHARCVLSEMKAKGCLEIRKRPTESLCGSRGWLPVYRVQAPKKKRK